MNRDELLSTLPLVELGRFIMAYRNPVVSLITACRQALDKFSTYQMVPSCRPLLYDLMRIRKRKQQQQPQPQLHLEPRKNPLSDRILVAFYWGSFTPVTHFLGPSKFHVWPVGAHLGGPPIFTCFITPAIPPGLASTAHPWCEMGLDILAKRGIQKSWPSGDFAPPN